MYLFANVNAIIMVSDPSGHQRQTLEPAYISALLSEGRYIYSVNDFLTIFTARCYASAVLAMALCPSVRPSVRHKSVFY